MFLSQPSRFFCYGFRQWKIPNLKPLISLHSGRVYFLNTTAALENLAPQAQDIFIVWGSLIYPEFESLARKIGARFLRIEDGFIRSVALGSDLVRPSSIIFDERGIYFDPSKPSDLEDMLNNIYFTDDDLHRAKKIRRQIIKNNITKYNTESDCPLQIVNEGKKTIFVPGQVEDDASIKLGAGIVRTNLGLLKAVREANPSAFIIYKPHPDVAARNRKGKVKDFDALMYADSIEKASSVISCNNFANEVHTMTSLAGFDALLRRKKVVTYGQPFYAGWGLTKDIYQDGEAFKRRTKKLTIDELVAGALIHYPIYYDWDLKGYTTCEATINHLVEERNRLEKSGELEKLRVGFIRRQFRKAGIFIKNYLVKGD